VKRIFFLALAAVALSAVPARAENTVVVMETSMGTIKIELFDDKAPTTVKNFLSYVDDKFYDDTIFHRVISNFMVQGGGFTTKEHKEKKTKDSIKNEAGLSNERATIAMARTTDPDSASAQFYINVRDNQGLNKGARPNDPAGYCVFGKVIDGIDVVDKIKAVKTGVGEFIDKRGEKQRFRDAPVEDVIIKSIRRNKK
jgi:cyclophilin family peptidyl-prolyl cis-trans isomerase